MIKGFCVNEKLTLIAKRRKNLILKAEAQRILLREDLAPLRKPLATVDRGLQVFRYFKQHPLLMLGATTLISFIQPKRISKWLHTSLSVLQLARSVTTLLVRK